MMLDSHYRPALFRRPGVIVAFSCAVALGIALMGLALMVLVPERPYLAVAPVIGIAAVVLGWRKPASVVMLLLVMALVVEVRPGADLTMAAFIPFWQNLSSIGIAPVPVSPAELVIVGGVGLWLLQAFARGDYRMHLSPTLLMFVGYLAMVVVGSVRGVLSGGNATIVLWEIRNQFFCAMLTFVALQALRTRREIDTLGWIIVLGTGFKALQGIWIWMAVYNRNFTGNALLTHDEALLFPAFYIWVLMLYVTGGSRRQRMVGTLLVPFVLIADFANNRRASTAVLVVALLALVFVLLRALPAQRVRIVQGLVVASLVIGAYTAAFWNSTSTLSQPIQAIRSQISPDQRDALSDLYREQEDQNILFAVSAYPIQGRGYGIAMDNVSGMVNIEAISPFILFMPHNSILWVWWRLGIIGFVLFWLAMGLGIARSCMIARTSDDPTTRRWAMFGVGVTIMFLLLGWYDQGLFSPREATLTFLALAVPDVLIRLARNDAADAQA